MEVFFLTLLITTVTCNGFYFNYDNLCLANNSGFLRHPHDCHKFIRCSHQRAYEFQCPANLLWHHEIKSCDFSYRTKCKLKADNEMEKEINEKKEENSFEETFKKEIQFTTAETTAISRKVKQKKNCLEAFKENVKTTAAKVALKDIVQAADDVNGLTDMMLTAISTEKNIITILAKTTKSARNKINELKANLPEVNIINSASITTPKIPVKTTEYERKTIFETNNSMLSSFPNCYLKKKFESVLNAPAKITESLHNKTNTVKLTDEGIEHIIATTINPLIPLTSMKSFETTNRNLAKEFPLEVITEDNSVNLTKDIHANYSTKCSKYVYNQLILKESTDSVSLTDSKYATGYAQSSVNSTVLANRTTLMDLNFLPETSATITESYFDSINLTSNVTANSTKGGNENAMLTIEDSVKLLNFLANSTAYNNRNVSTEFEIPVTPKDTSVNLTESILMDYYTQNYNSTKKSELLSTPFVNTENVTNSFSLTDDNVLFTTKDPSYLFNSSKNLAENNRNPATVIDYLTTAKNNSTKSTEKILTAYSTKSYSLNSANAIKSTSPSAKTQEITESSVNPLSKTALRVNYTNAFEFSTVATDSVNFTENMLNKNLIVNDRKDTAATTKTIPDLGANNKMETTALYYHIVNDATTPDPRLPFRSIECQGTNNRRQFKASKCYQYYQCFAGWAFLLNCHDGWLFKAEQGQCVLDADQECEL